MDYGDIDDMIDKFMNRKKYSDFDLKTLKLIEDKQIEQAIVDYLLDEIVKDDIENHYELIKTTRTCFQTVYTTFTLQAQIDNGGIYQLLDSPIGELLEEAMLGFHQIGAQNIERLLNSLIVHQLGGLTNYQTHRDNKTLLQFYEKLQIKESDIDLIEEKFYSYAEGLSQKRIDFIRNNLECFITE
jgi:hypothetical protein